MLAAVVRTTRLVTFIALLACGYAAAQQTEQPAKPAGENPIAALREQLTGAENLTEEERTEAEKLLADAASRREKAESLAAQVSQLESDQQKAADPPPKPPEYKTHTDAELGKLSPDELRAELTAAEQRTQAARDELDRLSAEIGRRAQRRQDIPELLSKARESLSRADAALQTEPTDEQPVLGAARRLYQQAHRERWRLGVQALEQEGRTYEATARQLTARRDASLAALQEADGYRQRVAQAAANAQRKEAERKAREARRAAINAHPALKSVAARNAELAEENRKLVERKARLDERLEETEALVKDITARYESVTQQATDAEGSPVVGAMLRSQQDQLPSLAPLRQQIRSRPEEQSKLRLDRHVWQNDREELMPVEDSVSRVVQEYLMETGDQLSGEVVEELRRLLEARIELLAQLTSNADDAVQKSSELLAKETEAVTTIKQLSDFIAARVFWVPSAPAISMREFHYTQDFWGSTAERWADVQTLGNTLLNDARRRPDLWAAAALLGLVLVGMRQWAKKQIRAAGEEATKPYATSFRPTAIATLATLVVAAPTAVLVGFLGNRFSAQASSSLAYGAGQGLLFMASAYFVLNLVRHACRPRGLAAQHFGWDPKALAAVRRSARGVQLLPITLLSVVLGIEAARNEASIHAIGRVSLMMSLVILCVLMARLLRSRGPLITAVRSAVGKAWVGRLLNLAAPLAVAACVALCVASAAGWHYTATQLTRRMLYTAAVVVACLALRGLLMRWLLVAYRRVAMQRAREKRQALQEAREHAPQENAAIEVETEVNLSDINHQARSLVDTGVIVALLGAVLLAWGDALPALSVLDQMELWQSSFTTDEGVPAWVTLADVLLGVAALVVTYFAAQNLPGLLEFSLFQKLPMDQGVRYAASSVTRYVISVVGFLIAMRLFGVSWNSVQWLVAAVSVGLGFGLQEIFANFVSGMILLLERPVRPGDVVTVGGVSGMVSKIRIRATTIQDWDNKELIVPNREFITGNLINWTLSSRMLRAVIKVGVAYGSDTNLVIKLLYEIAEREPAVIDNPAPFVLFDTFGDSTLNFELRIFVADISQLLETKHRLHMAIDEVFRANDVEIAFPQRDLHVRSLPEELRKMAAPHESNGRPEAAHSAEQQALQE